MHSFLQTAAPPPMTEREEKDGRKNPTTIYV